MGVVFEGGRVGGWAVVERRPARGSVSQRRQPRSRCSSCRLQGVLQLPSSLTLWRPWLSAVFPRHPSCHMKASRHRSFASSCINCREVLYEQGGDGRTRVTGLRLGKASEEQVVTADAYVAALDVPGAKRLIPQVRHRGVLPSSCVLACAAPLWRQAVRFGASSQSLTPPPPFHSAHPPTQPAGMAL